MPGPLSLLDWGIILAYIGFALWVGVRYAKRRSLSRISLKTSMISTERTTRIVRCKTALSSWRRKTRASSKSKFKSADTKRCLRCRKRNPARFL